MARRIVDSTWFLPAVGLVAGAGVFCVLLQGWLPNWLVWGLFAAVFVAPFAPLLAMLPVHVAAVRGGLIRRSGWPYKVTLEAEVVVVEHRGRVVRCSLDEVQHARRAFNDNATESSDLEEALGLFAARGRELVRMPLRAEGLVLLLRALAARGIEINDVLLAPPTVLD